MKIDNSLPKGRDLLSRGTSQSGVRLYNERLLLSLIRRHGSLSKADMTRLTGLSAQTVSVIVRQLEADGLLSKQTPQRGRIGQPSVPFSLNPEGAFSLGLKIGRRSADLILMDCVGGIRQHRQHRYAYPVPTELTGFVGEGIAAFDSNLTAAQRERILGLGIAMPFEFWLWEEEIGAPRAVLQEWRDFDIRRYLFELCRLPVHLCNDATAACAAELVFGRGGEHLDFLYFFIGAFVGGGIVLNGSLYPGRSGNAGALGSMPVTVTEGRRPVTRQLIRCASLYLLEQRLRSAGRDPELIWQAPENWDELGPVLDHWLDQTATALAAAIVSAAAVIDFQAVIIDGALPPAVRERLVVRTRRRIEQRDWRGLSPVVLVPGSIGAPARAMGGASLPLLASFALDREVLFKEESGG